MIEASLMITLSLLLIVILVHTSQASIKQNPEVGLIPLLMPHVRPSQEVYLCTKIRADNYFIVGFEPNATTNMVHHMLLYGCSEPGSEKPVWNCGEMTASDASRNEDEMNDIGSPCKKGSDPQIIYAWGRKAPKMELPKGVGFKVGKDSPIQYLVLQIHYAQAHNHHFRDGKKRKARADDSGILLRYTKQTLHKRAGVLLLGTSGMIPPQNVEHMEVACTFNGPKVIHPFAFRVHTHSLGKAVSGYRIRDGKWTLLGKKDPMELQMFHSIYNTEPIKAGDTLAARCTMVSNRRRFTYIGTTSEDEMCNFYMMYYVNHGDPLNEKYCISYGPPNYYWRNDASLKNIPDEEASQLD